MHRSLRALFVLAAIALASPGDGWAQTKIQRVGVLTFDKAEEADWFQRFRQKLGDEGWVEGRNMVFEFRSSNNDPSKFAEPAAELVRQQVDILLPVGPAAVRAAYAATRDIPIVAHDLETDPVAAGYARTYSRPGENLTGLFLDSPELAGKWLELLKVSIPGLSRAAVLWDVTSGPGPPRGGQEDGAGLWDQASDPADRHPGRHSEGALAAASATSSFDRLAFPDDVSSRARSSPSWRGSFGCRRRRCSGRLRKRGVCSRTARTSWLHGIASRFCIGKVLERHQAGRHPDRAAHYVRVRCESEDRQGNGSYHPGYCPGQSG